jgi:hypothetical protein
MPDWNPKFNIVSAEPFIANLTTVFGRDAVEALAWASPSPTLRPFQAINTERQASAQWPVLNLLPYGGDPQMSHDAARIDEKTRVLVEVETVARGANALSIYLVRYVLAVKSILYEMSVDDLTKDIPKPGRTRPNWDVSTERYGDRLYEAENLFTKVGSVVLTINYTQGKTNG